MAGTWYPDIRDVLAVHRRQLERFGGAPGLRDAGLIEAALARPQSGYYGDLIEEAAALWESLTMNHGFIDGNKRVGLAMTYVFLRINGFEVTASSRSVVAFVVGSLEAKRFEKSRLEAWLRRRTRPVA